MGSLSGGEAAGEDPRCGDRAGHGESRIEDDTMLRSTLRGVMLFTLLTLPPAVMADRTYNLLNGSTVPSGYTLSGTITTDGTIGTIQAANILSWTWTITNGVSSFTASSTGPGDVTTPGITATGAALVLPYAGSVYAEFMNQHYIVLNNNLEWHTGGDGTPIWEAALGPPVGGTGVSGFPYDLGGAPGTIALAFPVAVPEPSSLYIVGFGAVCVYVMGHKRRARRTATTDV